MPVKSPKRQPKDTFPEIPVGGTVPLPLQHQSISQVLRISLRRPNTAFAAHCGHGYNPVATQLCSCSIDYGLFLAVS